MQKRKIMKKRIISSTIIVFLIFMFIIFYKSLNKSSFYEPTSQIKNIPQFFAKSFYSKEKINSKKIFVKDKYYLLNIWASWCVPCREEHPLLLNLSKNKQIEIIGLNYKDNNKNAKFFLEELTNPYKTIISDKEGLIAIEWGAYGVPESFLINKKKIIKRFIGPLNKDSLFEIKSIIK